MKKEIRVYLVDLYEVSHTQNPRKWSDNKFITEAEKQGTVYTLQGFVDAYNEDETNQNNSVIRII
jgi:hypothetical protein